MICYIWPIKDPEGVNQRRKAIGFEQTVENYTQKLLDIEYKEYSLADIKPKD